MDAVSCRVMDSTVKSAHDCQVTAHHRRCSFLDEIGWRLPVDDDGRTTCISSACWDSLRQTLEEDFEIVFAYVLLSATTGEIFRVFSRSWRVMKSTNHKVWRQHVLSPSRHARALSNGAQQVPSQRRAERTWFVVSLLLVARYDT